ncbi:MAG: hypothetical protein COU42_01030 [Candidatus Nealsonbacteria bacterium CG10_big_fil_rev_8_21_14_0_10_36_24]|uniref:Uncharacterized protein n=1 Tax=Candidatus Nealsonbacteria bacterium CG10_big_fil_rev_8_21_14_0_10_36_24 TaxID=1974710 RepID=A0A2M6NSD6_9BACT|nr:MAG: hypothetical protein COU42_01030 [Candidatus Nealsonbacteria bacterium CG10_big_fil_rev_8_21_14_0_10_36_24]
MEALTTSFNIIENLPFIIFNLVFFVIFIFFLFGSFVWVFGKGEIQKIERGQKIILNSLYALFILLLVALVFFLGTYLLKKGEVLKPPLASQDFPSAPVSIAPVPPVFVEIGGSYFSGPWSLQELEKKNIFENTKISGLYTIMCKKNGDYGIIYIGRIGGEQINYQCWLENCENKIENLYMALLPISSEKFGRTEIEDLAQKIRNRVNPLCL